MNEQPRSGQHQRHFVYRSNVPPLFIVFMLVPLLFVMLSIGAAVLAGGALTALVLPLLFAGRRLMRRNPPRPTRTDDAIELSRSDYRSIDDETLKLTREK